MSKKFFSFDNPDGQLVPSSIKEGKWGKPLYKIKFMHRGLERGGSAEGFLRQFPGNYPQWGNCLFDFDVDCRDYDWLVVYHDLPKSGQMFTEEKLACPKERTLLITGEPSTITVFGKDYLRQFGFVLTFQEPWVIRHPGAIYHHPGLVWYYGLPYGGGKFITWDQMEASLPPEKPKLLSTVCSQRRGKITLHSARVDFTWLLKEDVPELDIFGHGVKAMDDKAEALDCYRHHIAIENHVYAHHLTEKLPDAFLGFTLPFYHGAPNASDYFPKESFVAIDINNYQKAREVIQYHLANNEYEDRLPYILEARRRVLEEQNLFAILDKKISDKDGVISSSTPNKIIRNRKTMRAKSPLAAVRSLGEKAVIKAYYRFSSYKRNMKE